RVFSHAFAMGGDYAYSLPHFIPNVIGNTFGYVALFVCGQWSLPFYLMLRVHSKMFALPIGLGILIILGLSIWYCRKMRWKKLLQKSSVPLYAIGFFLVTLLPYLGLGNIAQRYGYLASVGMVVLLLWIIETLVGKFAHHKKLVFVTGGLVGLGILLG